MAKSRWLAVLHHPFTVAGAGFVLAVTGLVEVIEQLTDSDPTNDGIGSEHGQTLFGVLLFIRSIGDGIESIRKMKRGLDDASGVLRGRDADDPRPE